MSGVMVRGGRNNNTRLCHNKAVAFRGYLSYSLFISKGDTHMATIKITATFHSEYRGTEGQQVAPQLEGSIRKTFNRGVVYDLFPQHPRSFDLYAEFETAEQRDAFIAAFPKYCGVVANRGGVMARLKSRITFSEDEVNKGVNETGIKRLRKIVEVARQLGHSFDHNGLPAINSYANIDEMLAAL
jgi:hypothetical protein